MHVGLWGTYITTDKVSKAAATIKLTVAVANTGPATAGVAVATEIFQLNA